MCVCYVVFCFGGVFANVYSVLLRKFGQTHMKVMITVLIFGETHIVMFTVFSFGHLKFGHLY